MIDQRVLSHLEIDAENGTIFWLKPPKNHPRLVGKEAGSLLSNKNGKNYWHIRFEGRSYKRSRLIFAYVHGRFPYPCVDHIDGNSLNDCALNLREATVTQNNWNHKSRKKEAATLMGVRALLSGKYQARIRCNHTEISLGVFQTENEAYAAYQKAREVYFGQYA
jgi:hypothetical protein